MGDLAREYSIQVRLSSEEHDRLAQLAKKNGVSMSDVVRQAITAQQYVSADFVQKFADEVKQALMTEDKRDTNHISDTDITTIKTLTSKIGDNGYIDLRDAQTKQLLGELKQISSKL